MKRRFIIFLTIIFCLAASRKHSLSGMVSKDSGHLKMAQGTLLAPERPLL